MKWGIIKGITTNPKIFSTEHDLTDWKQRVRELLGFKIPVSIELTRVNESVNNLISEAKTYVSEFSSNSNLVIKIPMFKDGRGLEVAKNLLDQRIHVNMTCLMHSAQVLLACEVGATFASLFFNRMTDYYTYPSWAFEEVNSSRELIESNDYKTRLICGSIRHPVDVITCFAAGAHIVTVPPKILDSLSYHPKTEETIIEFNNNWIEFLSRIRSGVKEKNEPFGHL